MCGIAPKAIITDQCQVMRRAIEIVFLETVHRWCIWHITMKLPVKLAGLEAYQDIKYYLLKVVHQSMTVEEFEDCGIIPSLHIISRKMSGWLTYMRNGSDGFLRFSIPISLRECR